MRSGRALPSTTSELITTSSTPRSDGSSNIVSSRMPSIIERRPLAPVVRSIAFLAMVRIAKKAIHRKTGARGLRSKMEGILLDTMFELPSLRGVEEVVISSEVVEGKARPLRIYSDRHEELGTSA